MASFEEFDDRFQYYIHGTNNENIESFFNKGLICDRGNSIISTLTPLDNDDIENLGLRAIEQYYAKRYGFEYCYIVKIPKYYMGWMIHRDNSIEPPLPIWIPESRNSGAYYGKISILTPHLIAGVYSVSRDQIMPNPNYNPKYDPAGMQYSQEQIEYMLTSDNAEYQKWVEFAQARDGYNFEELKRKDIAGNVWTPFLQRYEKMISEQYTPRPANLGKK